MESLRIIYHSQQSIITEEDSGEENSPSSYNKRDLSGDRYSESQFNIKERELSSSRSEENNEG
jgi:hypothetical protein